MAENDQIFEVHENLFLGAYWPKLNFDEIKKKGITAIVNLMEKNYYDPRSQGYAYLHKGFPDDWHLSWGFLEEILNFIEKHIKVGKVLVHCERGISRSGGIVVAWLLKENPSWNWNDALEYVNKSRLIFPAVEIKESILDYFEYIDGYRRNF